MTVRVFLRQCWGRAAGLLVLGVCSLPAEATPIRIVLLPQASLTRPVALLGDVAALTTADPATLRRLMLLPLGSGPAPGQTLQLSTATLQAWVRRQLGERVARAQWSGAASVEITGAAALAVSRSTADAEPLVKRGSFARLVWNAPGLHVETRVEVLQDGRAGQVVRVRAADAALSQRARVSGPGRVEGVLP